jgi:hypothetical protein
MAALIDGMTMPADVPWTSFLDLQEGTVIDSGVQEAEDDDDESVSELALDPERYAAIPRLESREEYQIMTAFAASIDDDELRERLDDALQGKGAFSRFRRVVDRDAELRDAWYAFKENELIRIARRWLSALDIEPIYELPRHEKPVVSAPLPVPMVGLFELLLLGAPDGKTELLEGQVLRQIRAKTSAEARAIFTRVARDLCRYFDVPWRKRLVEGTSKFDLEVAHLTVEDVLVTLGIDVPIVVWKAFC